MNEYDEIYLNLIKKLGNHLIEFQKFQSDELQNRIDFLEKLSGVKRKNPFRTTKKTYSDDE